jgi:predicted AAA+ superfamily ATPase
MFDRLINPIKSDSFFLLGARGTGKTTFLRHYFSDSASIWIDLLDPKEEDLFQRQPGELALRLQTLKPGDWVVIDEIQKAPRLLNIVHGFIESHRLKFALTGSSARRLKQKGVNLLAGRAFTNFAFPLTHVELAEDFVLQEALEWGTLPKVCRGLPDDSRAEFLRAYGLNYVTTEVQAEQWVRNIEPFRKFLPIAAQMNGKILNYSKIAREVGVDVSTIISYFDILEDTLLGYRLEAFHESLRKRQNQKPKFFFFDLGLKRALEQTLTVKLLPQTYGFGDAFEHFIICEMIRLNAYFRKDFRFSYLRTKDDAEIDIIIERPGQKNAYVEIKSTEHASESDIRTLKAFAKQNSQVDMYLLSRDPHAKQIGSIKFLPWQQGLIEIGFARTPHFGAAAR